jgi:hypothetical protein
VELTRIPVSAALVDMDVGVVDDRRKHTGSWRFESMGMAAIQSTTAHSSAVPGPLSRSRETKDELIRRRGARAVPPPACTCRFWSVMERTGSA